MTDSYIYDHVRTPRGKGRPDGALYEVTPIQLAAQALAALRDRNQLDTRLLDDVIFGCANPVGEQGANIPRLAALMADYAQEVGGIQLNRFCASGLDAVNFAAAQVACGQARAIVAGGVESMSRVPMGADGGAWANDPQVAWKSYFAPQGIGADLLATLDGFTREQLDQFALQSQQRADRAWRAGRFARSIVPVRDLLGDVLLERDEHMRPETTLASLSALKPVFTEMGEKGGFDGVAIQRYPQVEHIQHLHTAASASGIVDGAATLLIGSKAFGEAVGLKPRARVRAFTSIGSEPTIMLTGPVACTRKLLQRCGMRAGDVDLFEINEAFASVVLHYQRELGLDPERVNVNGGAIAMGHPLGATGVMLVGTVLDELERRGQSTAVITLCAAAGLSTATLIERL